MARRPRGRLMEAEVWQVELRDGPSGGRIRKTPLERKGAYLACEEGGDQGRNNGISAFTQGKNLTADVSIPATGKGELAVVHETLNCKRCGKLVLKPRRGTRKYCEDCSDILHHKVEHFPKGKSYSWKPRYPWVSMKLFCNNKGN